jgi:hypothetical protein
MKNVIEIIERMPKLAGFTTIFSFNPVTGEVTRMVMQKNAIMDDAAKAIANLLMGNAQYKVASMYFEYVNLASSGDMPSPPAFSPSEGVDYYIGLQYSPTNDFLRVPVIVSPVPTVNEAGNQVVSFYSITPSDNFGFWGKPFDPASNSAVFGGALVATPEPSYQSSDLIVARNYPAGAKVLKAPGEQISMIWSLEVMKP